MRPQPERRPKKCFCHGAPALLAAGALWLACAPLAAEGQHPSNRKPVAAAASNHGAPASPGVGRSAPSSSASASPSAAVAASPWAGRLRAFYGAYGRGPQARAAAYHALFAPQLTQFITMRNISVDQAIRAAELHCKGKDAIKYEVVSEVREQNTGAGSSVEAVVEASWETPLPQELSGALSGQMSGCDSEHLKLRHVRRLHVMLAADTRGRVQSYTEGPAPLPRFRVDGENTETGKREPTFASFVPTSQCEEAPGGDIELRIGAVVQFAGELIQGCSCGPGVEIFRKIQYDGESYWVVESAYFRTSDDQGNAHVGTVNYLVPVD